jgi:flavin-dependent dehydrogenase
VLSILNSLLSEDTMQLVDGSRVVIVGGGPAGSFTALHLLRYAAAAGLSLQVTILEARDFSLPGPGGCNKCAGILSANLTRRLGRLGLELPPDVIQSELHTYILHLESQSVPIHQPDSLQRTLSVYRGGGPRLAGPPAARSFDGWLLDQARGRGAVVRRGRVLAIQPGRQPVVVTRREELPADLVVLATGVNSRAPLGRTWGYRPPATEIMAQDEVPLPAGFADHSVHIYFDSPPGLIFGGLIPKGRFANISLLGRRLPPDAVNDFLVNQGLIDLFPEGAFALCGCAPRVAISSASKCYADRLVVVGDAAVTRLYKDGIGAAFITAEAAARTAVGRGVARGDFAAGYRPTYRRIAADNRYGRLLFRLWSVRQRTPFLLSTWQRAILAEADLPPEAQVHTRVLWGMFTGSESYRRLFWLSLSRTSLRSLWIGARQTWRGK